jgi:hypothetical protein
LIQTPTTLILGAGASIPYNFPSGRNLLLEVCNNLRDSQNDFFKLIYSSTTNDISLIENFRNALLHSSQPSIDAFIEKRPEFLEIGKATIIAALLPYENKKILDRNGNYRWYEYLFSKLLLKNPEDFANSKFSILTFNYDRSFDYCLFYSLKESFGLSEEKTVELINKIPIIHLYGKLGDLPSRGENIMEYGYCQIRPLQSFDIKRLLKEIKIIHEVDSETDEIRKAKEIIRDSVVIAFLGFGYHQLNIQRIMSALTKNGKSKAIYGTAFEIAPNDKENIKKTFNRYGGINLGGSNQEIIPFLSEQPILRIK